MDAQRDLTEHAGIANPTHLHDDIRNYSKESAQSWHKCKTESLSQQQAHFKQYENNHFAHDMQIHHDSPFANKPEAMHSRTQLEDIARKRLSIPQMKVMEKDLSAFENNAASNALDEKKVAKFYDATASLLKEQTMHYSPSQRNELALQLVHHAAHPEVVIQGSRNTCNVATVEYRLLVREPQAVAEMTAQVAKNGTFITADNTKLTDNWHSIKPGKSAEGDMLDPLVQTTLVNCHWASYKTWDGDTTDYRYEVDQKTGIGERIWKYDQESGTRTMKNGTDNLPLSDPDLESSFFRHIYNQASGAGDTTFAVEHANPNREKNVLIKETDEDCNYVKSPKELHDLLKTAVEQKQFPLVVAVHTGNRPFSTQELRNDPTMPGTDHNFGWHELAITKYDAATHTAKIHNSWGKESDININLDQLYKSMQKPASWEYNQINHLE